MTEQVEAPELAIAKDIVRRGLMGGGVLVGICMGVWGLDGLWSSGYALGLILCNFWLAASFIAWSFQISPTMLMVGVMGGYFIRLGMLTGAYFLVKNIGWFEVLPFAITLVVAHIVLLVWEIRYVSMSLAHPGLQPQGVRS
ncbi:MAG: ATP synthase subunit I [Acidimicrobiia bacterium]|nr:ATP synthase subunit I [Acidimicrobiia bacterium]MYC57168.1 ATP synthase subunit I [Acidimicrobiia bacterium]MYI29908.1 ATP synthase subunit I [Acidimicrobiia bacterium]